MLICSSCQFENPPGHNFCQQCGEPLVIPAEPLLQAILMPPNKLLLSPATYIDTAIDTVPVSELDRPAQGSKGTPKGTPKGTQRYQIITVLSQGIALVKDEKPDTRSPLQQQIRNLIGQPLSALQAVTALPPAAYPYILLSQAAPALHDAWQQDDTTVLITSAEQSTQQANLSSLIQSFSTAIDPLQHVYWLYMLTDLWVALEPLPQWRSSLLLANNLGLDHEQSVRVRQFIAPSESPGSLPPTLAELKAFLQSLLAQPHLGTIAPLRQMRKIILAIASAKTLEQLRSELTDIGEYLLSTPEAITPAVSAPAANVQSASVQSASVESDQWAIAATSPITLPSNATEDMPIEDMPIENDSLVDDIDLPEPTESDESTMVLPMKLISIESAGRTDVGRQREHNEDCFFIASSTQKRADNNGQTTEAHSLYVLCDGMGGHAGGEVASKLAAETLFDYFSEHWPHPLPREKPSPLPSKEVVVEAVKLANKAIYDINEKESRAGHERMGTTLVIVLLQGTEAMVAHVGDSRLYQHTRRMGLQQITTDHEVGQREIQRGIPHDIAYARPDAYQLTQALGPRDSADLMPSVAYLTFSEDTLLLLCSDGLSDNNLVEDYVSSHLDPILRGKKEIETGIDELIDLGNQVNGHDNISAIAIRAKVSPDISQLNKRNDSNRGLTVIQ